jgi:di/tricarboxylate transporter
MVIHGAQAGGFSPISVYGVTVNTIVDDAGLDGSPLALFLGSLFFNAGIGVLIFLVLGGRSLLGRHVDDHVAESGSSGGDGGSAPSAQPGGTAIKADEQAQAVETKPDEPAVTFDQVVTLVGLAALAVFALILDLDIGFVSITVAVVLALLSPQAQKGAVAQISWATVLLITGVLTFVGVLQEAGSVDYVGNAVTKLGSALLIALLLCYIGGIVSAFASSTAILGVTIPLAVPFLLAGEVSVVGLIVALAISSTIVDVSPFSTNGALVLANAPKDVDRDHFYKQILAYGALVVAIGPLVAWAVLVVPGWL